MITRQELHDIVNNGLWKQNAGLVQLLGLCPLLAISTSIVNGIMLASATILVMALASGGVSLLRNWIPYEIRIPVFILIAAVLVTVVDLVMHAWLYDLYLVLGIFIPLIITNCIVLARIEAFAAKTRPLPAIIDGAMMGIGLAWTLALLGGLREIIGAGTLFSGIELVIPGWQSWKVMPDKYDGFLLWLLPPGAFITLGFMIAGKNWLESRAMQRNYMPPAPLSPAKAQAS